MEVHAHSHTERKKWTHYLWEFLMLFLAVFCGFLAENFREHQIEKRREKQYIISMIADLEVDTTNLNAVIEYNINKVNGMDTLSDILVDTDLSDSSQLRLFKLNFAYTSNMLPIVINDRTAKQLLSSGNMRLIHDQKTSDTIIQYYGEQKDAIIDQGEMYKELMKRLLYFSEEIFDNLYAKVKFRSDTSVFRNKQWDKLRLLIHDNSILKKYARMVATTQNVVAYYVSLLCDIKKMAVSLMIFLKKEYHLK